MELLLVRQLLLITIRVNHCIQRSCLFQPWLHHRTSDVGALDPRTSVGASDPQTSNVGALDHETSAVGCALDEGGARAASTLNLQSESLVSACPGESAKTGTDRVRHMYMPDEQIFASFTSKGAYEREWRNKEKKKGGKKHKKQSAGKKELLACLTSMLCM